MKLPNGHASVVEIEKTRDYCWSLVHPRGRHKARVFQSALRISEADADELRKALVDVAMNGDASLGTSDDYGTRHIIDFEMKRGERTAEIRSCRIVRKGETSQRFVTSYVR